MGGNQERRWLDEISDEDLNELVELAHQVLAEAYSRAHARSHPAPAERLAS